MVSNPYVTPEEVRTWLGVDDTKYTDTYLNMIINMKVDYIDRITMTTWNGNTRTTREFHDLTRPKWGWWIYRLGFPVFLGHTFIREITSLKIFNGNAWEDWVGKYTEGRQEMYWVDYLEGIIYLNMFVIPMAGKEIDVTYTYGRDDLPEYIKELCLLLVVRDVLMNERRFFAIPEGSQGVSIDSQLDYVNKRINELEEMVRAVVIPKIGL